MKRVNGVISWDECFMEMAHLIAQRSKDPNTQVGAVIVDGHNKVVSMGYNGMPLTSTYGDHQLIPENNDDVYPWVVDDDPKKCKYSYVVHAELNAILSSPRKSNSDYLTLYSTHQICNECAKAIVQWGVSVVIYDIPRDNWQTKVGTLILNNAGIDCSKYKEGK